MTTEPSTVSARQVAQTPSRHEYGTSGRSGSTASSTERSSGPTRTVVFSPRTITVTSLSTTTPDGSPAPSSSPDVNSSRWIERADTDREPSSAVISPTSSSGPQSSQSSTSPG